MKRRHCGTRAAGVLEVSQRRQEAANSSLLWKEKAISSGDASLRLRLAECVHGPGSGRRRGPLRQSALARHVAFTGINRPFGDGAWDVYPGDTLTLTDSCHSLPCLTVSPSPSRPLGQQQPAVGRGRAGVRVRHEHREPHVTATLGGAVWGFLQWRPDHLRHVHLWRSVSAPGVRCPRGASLMGTNEGGSLYHSPLEGLGVCLPSSGTRQLSVKLAAGGWGTGGT